MVTRHLHVIHLLIRSMQGNGVVFLTYPHDKWVDGTGQPYLTLPTKRSVSDLFAPFQHGMSVVEFVDQVAREDLGLRTDEYVLEQEIEPAEAEFVSPSQHVVTNYSIFPLDVWVDPDQHVSLASRTDGQWLTCDEALVHPRLSPTAAAVFHLLRSREQRLGTIYEAEPTSEHKPEAPRRLLGDVPSQPTMDGLAKKWFSRNSHGVRHLDKPTLDRILDVGSRALNLRVADPYLRYQMQGLGFTWSFFTHKDPQDCHAHSAPVVEIYGILEGRLEVWWKPYYDRGTSAWSHRILEAGDWLEVDSLQCHIVHWLGEGKGVVFKAGPGPLAEVGKLGVKGKTPCDGCPCMKPEQVKILEVARGKQ